MELGSAAEADIDGSSPAEAETAEDSGPSPSLFGSEMGPDLEQLTFPELAPPSQPFFTSLRPRSVALWRANRRALLVALIGTASLRFITEWIGLLAQYGASFPRQVFRHPGDLLQVWSHGSAGYYLSIAQHGYAGKSVRPGQSIDGIAFSPLYPWGIRLVHTITHLGWLASAELLSAIAVVVAITILYRVAAAAFGEKVGDTTILALLAFPTAFFFLTPYPDGLALVLVMLAMLAANRGKWLLAGVLAAAATLDRYYLCVILIALGMEIWQQRRDRIHGGGLPEVWGHELVRVTAAVSPTLLAMGIWMAYQQVHIGNQFAFVHAQTLEFHRHIAPPWTMFTNVGRDLIHWRFTSAGVAGVTEAIDLVTVLLLAGVSVHVYLHVRRSYGVFLGLCWCVYTFETFLLGITREVLVLFPLFISLGVWASRRTWRERALLLLFVPCGYFMITRFVTGAYAG
jgi:Dolichyl-phosphate-mannose-protein mannosyltransferase